MAKRFAQLHTSALDLCMPPVQICKAETMHRGPRVSGSLKHVNHHLIRKINKTPSSSLGEKERELTSFAIPSPIVQNLYCMNIIKYAYKWNLYNNLFNVHTRFWIQYFWLFILYLVMGEMIIGGGLWYKEVIRTLVSQLTTGTGVENQC